MLDVADHLWPATKGSLASFLERNGFSEVSFGKIPSVHLVEYMDEIDVLGEV
jgi:hypothetical protein